MKLKIETKYFGWCEECEWALTHKDMDFVAIEATRHQGRTDHHTTVDQVEAEVPNETENRD